MKKNSLIFKIKHNILEYLTTKVLSHFLGVNIFAELHSHVFDADAGNNHFVLLLKSICFKYFNLRLHYLVKNNNSNDEKKRQFYYN